MTSGLDKRQKGAFLSLSQSLALELRIRLSSQPEKETVFYAPVVCYSELHKMPEEAAAAQGGAAAAVVFGTSAFKRPQYAAEVQDFLQKRAKSDEVQRVQR